MLVRVAQANVSPPLSHVRIQETRLVGYHKKHDYYHDNSMGNDHATDITQSIIQCKYEGGEQDIE